MPLTKAELETIAQFDRSYGFVRSPVMQSIERSVCGCDYGGTSWTTREEAMSLARSLSLSPAKRLLEIGAGSGWPGLFLAKSFGCSTVLVDLPPEGLRAAAARAQVEKLDGRCLIAQADAARLPLQDRAFDAIEHSDVLCCLEDKLGVLRECRRTIRDGGRMGFTVIYVAPHLSVSERDEAIAAGPPFIETEIDYEPMLGETGWRLESQTDVTETYLATTRRLIEALSAHLDQLEGVMGASEGTDWLSRTQSKLPAIERGLVKRAMFLAAPA